MRNSWQYIRHRQNKPWNLGGGTAFLHSGAAIKPVRLTDEDRPFPKASGI